MELNACYHDSMDGATSKAADLPDVTELTRQELQAALHPHEPYRAAQIFRWIYRRGLNDFTRMSDLPKALRDELGTRFRFGTPRCVDRLRSNDGTEKFLFELEDGRRIESVFIPDTPRQTFCVSTQVGCAMKCAFCLTGRMGLVRHLTAGEIVAQVRIMARAVGLGPTRFNVVFMGMGEPLHNYDETMKAIRVLADPEGLAISPRRMTLSTVGATRHLERLAQEPIMPNLAVSLHATTDALRDRLVPINRKYRLSELIEVCRRLPLKNRSRITFEYVLLDGVNDTPEDARRLAKLAASLRAKVNLIALNEAPGIPFARPSDERVDRFAAGVAAHHVTVSVRKSRGRDIRAACGQLSTEGLVPSPAQALAAEL